MLYRRAHLWVVLSTLVLSSCSGVKESEEYKALQGEVDALSQELANLESSLSTETSEFDALPQTQATEIANAKSSVEQVKQEREANRIALAKLLESPATQQKVIQKFVVDQCREWGALILRSSGQIDGDDERLAWVDDQRGDWTWEFSDWNTFGGTSPQSLLDFNKAMQKPCDIAYDRGKDDFYKTCESVSRMQLKKNPDQFKGDCIRGRLRIAQFDSNTGPCAFQGYFGGGYDVRVQVGVTLNTATHSTTTQCSWTEKLVEDMSIEVWAFVLGSYQYSTTSGGSQTVPALRLVAWRG